MTPTAKERSPHFNDSLTINLTGKTAERKRSKQEEINKMYARRAIENYQDKKELGLFDEL